MTKSQIFRRILAKNDGTIAMDAFDGISALIAEKVGFQCIFAGGLPIGGSMGLRDFNELTATQILQIVEYMSDATNIPILFDGDTGYGNFNDACRLVKKLCKLQVAGVTLEDTKDKIISHSGEPKSPHNLESIENVCGKIKAMKDAQTDSNFAVVGRIHALNFNAPMENAVDRAIAYQEAGADAIFIHSNKSTPHEIFTFADTWHNKLRSPCPLIISMMYYFATPIEEMRKARLSIIIVPAYNLRASIKQMYDISLRIKNGEGLSSIEKDVAPLSQLLDLVNNDALAQAEDKYFPNRARH